MVEYQDKFHLQLLVFHLQENMPPKIFGCVSIRAQTYKSFPTHLHFKMVVFSENYNELGSRLPRLLN